MSKIIQIEVTSFEGCDYIYALTDKGELWTFGLSLEESVWKTIELPKELKGN